MLARSVALALQSLAGRAKAVGLSHGWLHDPGHWIVLDQVLVCAYPRGREGGNGMRRHRVSVLINLHERAHDPKWLETWGLSEVHLPVKNWAPPTAGQVALAIASIDEAQAHGLRVAIHCGAGLGRAGTVAACYLVHLGSTPREAIEHVRNLRPGSISALAQVRAVAQHRSSGK